MIGIEFLFQIDAFIVLPLPFRTKSILKDLQSITSFMVITGVPCLRFTDREKVPYSHPTSGKGPEPHEVWCFFTDPQTQRGIWKTYWFSSAFQKTTTTVNIAESCSSPKFSSRFLFRSSTQMLHVWNIYLHLP